MFFCPSTLPFTGSNVWIPQRFEGDRVGRKEEFHLVASPASCLSHRVDDNIVFLPCELERWVVAPMHRRNKEWFMGGKIPVHV